VRGLITAEDVLRDAVERFDRIAIACSFQKEASVILDLATKVAGGRAADAFDVFTLDTGVLFEETHETWAAFERHFGVKIDGLRGEQPDRLWETDPDGCCNARKVVPMRDRLEGYDAWVTGLRRDQSPTRAATEHVAWDEKYGLHKIVPLADWSERDVWRHIAEHGLPYHELHDRGYGSIGCVPCTKPGEGREGRWAGTGKLECGLHAA
jgi:phosphoadenosine phosphosulfate reductase